MTDSSFSVASAVYLSRCALFGAGILRKNIANIAINNY